MNKESQDARRVRVGMGQMLVEGGKVERNLARAAKMIEEAALRGCAVVVLPECMDLGWTHPSARELAQSVPGKVSDALGEAARKHSIYVCSGLTERDGERVYNAAVLIGPAGEILLKHRKINELDIAHHLYSPGDRLGVAETAFGRVGVDICADNFPDSQALAHAMGRMGAQMILSPSAWAVPKNHDNAREPYGKWWIDSYSTVAKWYDMPVIGVSNVGPIEGGPWDGRLCIGCSLAVGADGSVIAQGKYGVDAEELMVAEVEVHPRKKWGTEMGPELRRRGYEGV